MPAPDVFVDDAGTIIRYRFLKEDGTGEDLSAASGVKFRFVAPDEVVFDVVAVNADAANGLFEYVTLTGHWLATPGLWLLYPRAEITSPTDLFRGAVKQLNIIDVPAVT